jgi:alpha-amylase
MNDVILHAFDWRYTNLANHADEIAALGYGAVLIPPPLYSRDDESGEAWWNRYQPKDYRVLRSYLGNKHDLEGAVAALHTEGVRVYADVVFNHMANENRPDRGYFPGEVELRRYKRQRDEFERDRLYGNLDVGLFSPWDFNSDGNIQDWTDLHEAIEHSLSGLPDLDLNQWVIEQQRACLSALNAIRFDGYRVDAVKHLPEEHLRRVFVTAEMAGKFLFGESLTSNDLEEGAFLWPLLDIPGLAFYDFLLHETLRRVFSPSGSMRELVDPAAFGQALPWWQAVTFSVTHDMPNNEGFRGVMLHPQDEYLANVYLLGRDGGVPLVYTDHNQSARAHPEDRDRWAQAWQREDLAAMVRFHNAAQGQPQRSLFEADGFVVFARGDLGLIAINKTEQWQHPTISTWGLRPGNYRCQIHGQTMAVTGEHFSLAIPPREAQMWLWAGL